MNEVKIENRIGDAIVHRIIRAHRERTPWKCCIVIPLLPGFAFPVDHGDASAIRIILECQNRTICRGPNSIFARLRKEGIDVCPPHPTMRSDEVLTRGCSPMTTLQCFLFATGASSVGTS